MSIEKSINGSRDHLSTLVDAPVFLGWPKDDVKGVYIFIYLVSEENFHRTRGELFLPQKIRALILINMDKEYSIIDNIIFSLQRCPSFGIEREICSIVRSPISIEEVAPIFLSHNAPFRLALAYEFKSIVCG